MKNIVVLITLVCIGLTAQRIRSQPATKPDPGSQIEGTYKVSKMTVFMPGQAPQVVEMGQPGNRISAVVTAKRKSERYVTLTFSQFQNATQLLSFRYGDAYLRTTLKGYDLAIDGTKMGMTDGTNLTIDVSATDKKTGQQKRSLILCKKG